VSALLDLAAVASRLGISRTSAWRLVSSGAIASVQVTAKLRRVDAADLERFIDAHRSQPVADVAPLRKSRKEAPP
jgi:excisionase family DNA binding protein